MKDIRGAVGFSRHETGPGPDRPRRHPAARFGNFSGCFKNFSFFLRKNAKKNVKTLDKNFRVW
jgi:hypothetical protein